MKKYLLPALLCLALVLATPGVALADSGKCLSRTAQAVMFVNSIDDTVLYQNVFPLDQNYNVILYPFDPGDVVWWKVVNRTVGGKVVGSVIRLGTWAFTYSGLLDTTQAGDIDGSLVITTRRGDIYAQASGSTAVIRAGWWPRKGPFIDVTFNLDSLTITGGTGRFEGVSGTGTVGRPGERVRLFIDETGHVNSVMGKLTLNLDITFPNGDCGDGEDD